MRAALTLAGALMVALLPLAALAQDRAQTLADIRQELTLLQGQIQSLRSELATTGGGTVAPATGSTLERLDTLEAALRNLTSKTETLEFRINQIVTDGTNRIGDIEFRLQELAGGDLGALPPTAPLGGEAPAVVAQPTLPTANADPGGPQLAMAEQADFDRARGAYDAGNFEAAASAFAQFTTTYTGGPLTQEAHFLRGEAFTQLGRTSDAARAYLDAFSGAPDGIRAPEALFKLGQALGQLGQGPEACVTLQEVGARYPGTQPAADAAAALRAFGCP